MYPYKIIKYICKFIYVKLILLTKFYLRIYI